MKGDQVDFEIDIDADLRDVFNWNVKQIYVYIEAEYETAKEHYNRAVVWDKIIEDKDSAYIKVEREMIEYPLMDIHRLLRYV